MSSRTQKAPVAGYQHGRVPREQRHRQLLDVAEQLFADNGYQGTSLEDIAQAAGVTRPIIYSHFGTRDDIYLACVKRARQQFEQRLSEALMPIDDLSAKFAVGARVYFEYVQSHPAAWNVLFGSGTAVAGKAADECMKLRFATADHIAHLMLRLLPEGESRRVAVYSQALAGAGHQLASWWQHHPEYSIDEVVGLYLNFCWPSLQELATRHLQAIKARSDAQSLSTPTFTFPAPPNP